VKGEIPSKKVYEDSNSFVILDINPRNPGHVLVMPKKHYETIFEMPESEAGEFFRTVKRMADACRSAVKADGVSICQSNGRSAGQMVLHMHAHVIPRFNTEGPPGLETILPVKRMDDAGMNRIAETLNKSVPSRTMEMPRPAKPAKEEKKELEIEDEEDIDFSF
jgi:histidine triad (HIT) family protein